MNLKTEQGRNQAIEAIEQSFINSLRDIGVELSDTVVANIKESSIEVAIEADDEIKKKGIKVAFASSVVLFCNRPNQINFASSGKFDNTQKEGYWRTIHAASILKNWEKVCEAVNEHCQKYSDLIQEIQKQNP